MASFYKRIILIALIFMISITISMAYRNLSEDDSDDLYGDDPDSEDGDGDEINYPGDGERDDSEIGRYLRDLCSDTKKSKQCWKIIKPEIDRFTDTNSRNVAGVVIDLASAKAGEIREKLEELRKDSNDDELKEKYKSCSSNYHDINRDLDIVKTSLYSDSDGKFPSEFDDVKEELKNCRRKFGENSDDPAHIRNRNKEFGRYLEILRVATKRVERNEDDDEGWRK